MKLNIKIGHTPTEEGKYFWVGDFGSIKIVTVKEHRGKYIRDIWFGVVEFNDRNVWAFPEQFSTKLDISVDKG